MAASAKCWARASRRRLALVVLWLLLASGGCRKASAPVFDVPALVGKNIDAVTAQLGAPSRESDLGDTAQKTWVREGKVLLVTWRKANKRVTSFALTSENAEALRDELKAQLLIPGRIKADDSRHRIEWIEAPERPFFYVGVRVIPHPVKHRVVLRVTGSPALVQVSYALHQNGAATKSETLLTLPPWESTLEVFDDTQITLSSRLFRSLGGAFTMKAQIEIDGKIAREVSSSGAPLQTAWEL